MTRRVLALLLTAIDPRALGAQEPAPQPAAQSAAWATREEMIPMRDGVKLFTIVYTPRDTAQQYPFLMTRTAYGIAPYGASEYRAILGPNNGAVKLMLPDGFTTDAVFQRSEGGTPNAKDANADSPA